MGDTVTVAIYNLHLFGMTLHYSVTLYVCTYIFLIGEHLSQLTKICTKIYTHTSIMKNVITLFTNENMKELMAKEVQKYSKMMSQLLKQA